MVKPYEKMAGNDEIIHHDQSGGEPVGVAVSVLDADGTFVKWGDDCEEMFGLKAAEVLGEKTPQNFAVEPYNLDDVLEIARRDGAKNEEIVLTGADGKPFVVHQSIKTLSHKTADAIDCAYVCCMVDVTSGKQREEDLRRERNRLEVLVEAMGAGLALFDENMRLQWANERLYQWFDVEQGARCCHIYYDEERPPHCILERVHSGEAPLHTTTQCVDEDGRWRCYLNVVTEVDIGHHRYLVLTTDITHERKQQEHVRMIDRLSRVLQGSLDLDRVLYLSLMCVTAGHAFGFSRAFILLLNSEETVLEGACAAGPISEEKAECVWKRVAHQGNGDLDSEGFGFGVETERLTEKVRDLDIPVTGMCERALRVHEPTVVKNKNEEARLPDDLREKLDLQECVIVPLITGDTAKGLMIADNKLSGSPLKVDSLEELQVFATQASMAIANAQSYRKIQKQIEELQTAQKKLVESERLASVGRMAAQMAHQMRTPLASIGGYAQAIMRSASDDSKVYRNASIIYDEEQNLEGEVNATLELLRPVEAQMRQCDLNALIKESVRRFFADKKTEDMQVSLSLAEPLQDVPLDPKLVQQLITNLLENAFQAVRGQPIQRVRVGTRSTDQSVEFWVSDTGQGMDERTREKIFAPFYTTKKDGTGLGLAIARRIVREHDGKLWCESERGKGSTFGITLPLGVEETAI